MKIEDILAEYRQAKDKAIEAIKNEVLKDCATYKEAKGKLFILRASIKWNSGPTYDHLFNEVAELLEKDKDMPIAGRFVELEKKVAELERRIPERPETKEINTAIIVTANDLEELKKRLLSDLQKEASRLL